MLPRQEGLAPDTFVLVKQVKYLGFSGETIARREKLPKAPRLRLYIHTQTHIHTYIYIYLRGVVAEDAEINDHIDTDTDTDTDTNHTHTRRHLRGEVAKGSEIQDNFYGEGPEHFVAPCRRK
jgi:hypothetical protein